jgi:hypothetical protein
MGWDCCANVVNLCSDNRSEVGRNEEQDDKAEVEVLLSIKKSSDSNLLSRFFKPMAI